MIATLDEFEKGNTGNNTLGPEHRIHRVQWSPTCTCTSQSRHVYIHITATVVVHTHGGRESWANIQVKYG